MQMLEVYFLFFCICFFRVLLSSDGDAQSDTRFSSATRAGLFDVRRDHLSTQCYAPLRTSYVDRIRACHETLLRNAPRVDRWFAEVISVIFFFHFFLCTNDTCAGGPATRCAFCDAHTARPDPKVGALPLLRTALAHFFLVCSIQDREAHLGHDIRGQRAGARRHRPTANTSPVCPLRPYPMVGDVLAYKKIQIKS